jgi:hypothetical protein
MEAKTKIYLSPSSWDSHGRLMIVKNSFQHNSHLTNTAKKNVAFTTETEIPSAPREPCMLKSKEFPHYEYAIQFPEKVVSPLK